MARISITELDSLSQRELDRLISLTDCLRFEVPVCVDQRTALVQANESLRAGLRDSHAIRIDTRGFDSMSNFELYTNLRFNGLEFVRFPEPQVLTFDDVENMSDLEIMEISERGGGVLSLDDIQRDELLRARVAWIDALDPDVAEALAIQEVTASNWNLYAENRINGIAPATQIQVPASAMSM